MSLQPSEQVLQLGPEHCPVIHASTPGSEVASSSGTAPVAIGSATSHSPVEALSTVLQPDVSPSRSS